MVSPVNQAEKLDNLEQAMERLKINILGICKMRWKGVGETLSDQHTTTCSKGVKHERGVRIMLDESHAKSLKGYCAVSDCTPRKTACKTI